MEDEPTIDRSEMNRRREEENEDEDYEEAYGNKSLGGEIDPDTSFLVDTPEKPTSGIFPDNYTAAERKKMIDQPRVIQDFTTAERMKFGRPDAMEERREERRDERNEKPGEMVMERAKERVKERPKERPKPKGEIPALEIKDIKFRKELTQKKEFFKKMGININKGDGPYSKMIFDDLNLDYGANKKLKGAHYNNTKILKLKDGSKDEFVYSTAKGNILVVGAFKKTLEKAQKEHAKTPAVVVGKRLDPAPVSDEALEDIVGKARKEIGAQADDLQEKIAKEKKLLVSRVERRDRDRDDRGKPERDRRRDEESSKQKIEMKDLAKVREDRAKKDMDRTERYRVEMEKRKDRERIEMKDLAKAREDREELAKVERDKEIRASAAEDRSRKHTDTGVQTDDGMYDYIENMTNRQYDSLDDDVINLNADELREIRGLLETDWGKSLREEDDATIKKRLDSLKIDKKYWSDLAIKAKEAGDVKRHIFLESVAKLASLRVDEFKLKLNEKPESEVGIRILENEADVNDLAKLDRFKKWAKENLLGLSAITITIAGLVTTVVMGVRTVVKGGASALGAEKIWTCYRSYWNSCSWCFKFPRAGACISSSKLVVISVSCGLFRLRWVH